MPHRYNVAVKVAGPQALGKRALRNGRDKWIKTMLYAREDPRISCWRYDHADPESGTDQLCKTLEMNHDRSPFWYTKGRDGPPEGKIAAKIILDDRQLKLVGDRKQLLPPSVRQRRPSGILE